MKNLTISSSTAITPHVLVVGAGPIGLLTAIQSKFLNPALEILMLEK